MDQIPKAMRDLRSKDYSSIFYYRPHHSVGTWRKSHTKQSADGVPRLQPEERIEMPCWTRTQITLEIGNMSPDLLVQALEVLGLNPSKLNQNVLGQKSSVRVVFAGGWYQDGKLTMNQNNPALVDRIKRQYTTQMSMYQAQRLGYRVKQVAENQFQLRK